MDDTPFTDFTPSPIEQELDERTRLFWGRVFRYAIFPFPGLAGFFMALAVLAWTPFLVAALLVLLIWGACLFAQDENRERAWRWFGLALDVFFAWCAQAMRWLRREPPTLAQRLVEEYRIEGETAVRAASLGTAEGDQQAELQVAGWIELINTNNRTIENPGTPADARRQLAYLNAQLRERIRQVRAVYEAPVATPESMGDQRMSFFGPVAASPLGWLRWAPWALAGVLGLTTGWFMVAERDARGDLKDANRRLGIEHAQRVAAEDVLLQYQDALTDAQAANRQNAEALEAERARVRAARDRERRRQRELEQVNGGGPAPDWYGILQQPGPGAGAGDGGGPAGP